jgi:hypothetical protein
MRNGVAPRLLLLALALALWGAGAPPVAGAAAGRAALVAKLPAVEAALQGGPFDLPIHVETRDEGDGLRGDVYGVFPQPFERVSRALRDAASWCEIVPLHLNVKACTHRREAGRDLLTVYSGRKTYQRPEDVFRMEWRFQLLRSSSDFLDLRLSSPEGPLDTRDYALRLSAIPLPEGGTFVHLSYAYRAGLLARVAMRGYLATAGRDKVGFSSAGRDSHGREMLVGGRRGVIERNAVRYHLAIQAYLDTLDVSEGQRFEARIARWWALTERHHRQLFELEKAQYLDCKRRERADQLRLQRALPDAATRTGVAAALP